jgi:DNA-binding response OmpR family regulator
VVDDDPVSRRLAVQSLRKLDLNPEVTEAAGGAEALEKVAARAPDLVVLDVMMPGMSGLEVCQRLRSDLRTAFLPILMLTANTDEGSRLQGFVAGTDDYMGKPFSVLELHARVRRLLRRTYGL